MTNDRIYSFLSLAKKAGAVISGHDACERAAKKGKVKLMIITEDASQNTKDRFTKIGRRYAVKIMEFGNMFETGKRTGTGKRSIIGITSKDFAGHIENIICTSLSNNGGEELE